MSAGTVEAPDRREGPPLAGEEGSAARALRVLVVLGVALLGVGAVAIVGHRPAPEQPSSFSTPLSARFGAVRGATAQERLSQLQDRVRAEPDDGGAWAALGSAYVEAARTSADPGHYPKAQGAFEKSFALQPDNVAALAGMAALANARHDFGAGLAWAERARAASPKDPAVWGPLADALVELGRYEEGYNAIQRMVDLEPSLASYARVSYARELQGDVRAAVQALEAAAGVAASPSEKAFAVFQLGELHWNAGRIEEAAAAYRRASDLDPSYVAPSAGVARVAWAQGRIDEAVEGYRQVVDRLPAPEYVTELADLYTITGRTDQAREQMAVLDAQERILVANGVNVDLELSLFSADHGIDLERGLLAATKEWERRKSIFVADALAWQLHASGRNEEALVLANQALQLGTANPLFHFHRSQIALALGQRDAAITDLQRALELNPHFSILHARAAAERLRELQSGT